MRFLRGEVSISAAGRRACFRKDVWWAKGLHLYKSTGVGGGLDIETEDRDSLPYLKESRHHHARGPRREC